MPDPITFQGALHRIYQDDQGETRVTFSVPLSDLKKILKLGEWTQRLLTVTVQVDQ